MTSLMTSYFKIMCFLVFLDCLHRNNQFCKYLTEFAVSLTDSSVSKKAKHYQYQQYIFSLVSACCSSIRRNMWLKYLVLQLCCIPLLAINHFVCVTIIIVFISRLAWSTFSFCKTVAACWFRKKFI